MALEGSSRDGRLNFKTAVRQLILANYGTDADGKRRRFPTEKEKEDFITSYMDRIDMREITQGYLLMAASIIPQRQQIQFAVVDTQQVNGSPNTPICRLLTMQDSFLISALSYFLLNYSYTGDLSSPLYTAGNDWSPITYASAWYNNGSGVTLDPGVNMMWTGAYLQLAINKHLIIPYWDCMQHYYAPDTQSTPTIVSPSAYMEKQKNKYDGSSDGYVPMQPNVVIGGGRNNDLRLFLPANVPATIAPFNGSLYNASSGVGVVLQACVKTQGILMQNSTSVK